MQNFIKDETGAVTVDWVVLTAALVGLGLAVMAVVSGGIETQSSNISDTMTDDSIIRTAFTGSAVGNFNSACGGYAGCDASLGSLADLSNSDFNTLRDNHDASLATNDIGNQNLAAGLTLNGDGDWEDAGGNVDQGATDAYNAAVAYDAAATAAVNAEDSARSNN